MRFYAMRADNEYAAYRLRLLSMSSRRAVDLMTTPEFLASAVA